MFNITMGIQSGSEDILYNVFNRRTPKGRIIKTAFILNKLKLPLRPQFDIITNNPFETEDDRRKTLELLMRLPKPVNFGLTKLSFIPGSKIVKMLEEKMIDRKVDDKIYKFWNILYLLNRYRFFPNRLIRILSRSTFFRKNPAILQPLLIIKLLEVKCQDIAEKIKNCLPPNIILLLKRTRYVLKGY